MATRMAQYSLSPPARPFQMRTWKVSFCLMKMGGCWEVPYHGDASCEADEDEADAQFGFIWEERPGQTKLNFVSFEISTKDILRGLP